MCSSRSLHCSLILWWTCTTFVLSNLALLFCICLLAVALVAMYPSIFHLFAQVTLIEDGSQEISLTVVGLTKYGYLRAVSNGEEYALHPDGNR